jgi:RNase P subunit RPR2
VEKRKAERYIKRLSCEFSGAGKTHRGFVSDVSDNGLFIRTRRSFREGSDVDIKLHLPDDSISSLSGVVRRALTTHEGTLTKNGMGIELLQKDDNYIRLLKELKGEEEKKRLKKKKPEAREPEKKPEEKKPEKVVIQCAICGVKNAVPHNKLSLGPKCGGCKAPLEFGEDFHDAKADAEKAEPVLIACPECGAKNKVPADKLSLGPKCGACKARLVPKEEEPAPEEPAPEEPASADEEPPPEEEKKEVEFVMIKCPGCGTKNKLPANKLSLGPKCGNCKEPLPTE